MRVFLAGATGAIGKELVPRLVARGHHVIALTRSEEKAQRLRAPSVEAVVADVYDTAALTTVMKDARPDAVVHQMTAIPERVNPRKIGRQFAETNRLRTDGTRSLVAAARAAGVKRFVSQSIAFAYAPRDGVRTEDDPLYTEAPAAARALIDAVATNERETLAMPEGIVLRYGYFWGRGTAYDRGAQFEQDLKRRRLPIVGKGRGVFSFIHVEDAADATVLALEKGIPGVFNIVDDEPAPVSDWLPKLAERWGCPKPMRVPRFLARLVAGSYAVYMMDEVPGASNAKARRALGWTPAHPSLLGSL
jgi:nucleoside-diphosphate-sugar epimerase